MQTCDKRQSTVQQPYMRLALVQKDIKTPKYIKNIKRYSDFYSVAVKSTLFWPFSRSELGY